MAAQHHWEELQRLGGILTGPASTQGDLFEASQALYQLFLQVSGLDPASAGTLDDLLLPQGKALAPGWAAHCILDFQRTGTLLGGLLQAIGAARQRFPHTPIHVLYAGCGPFATLALPLIPLLEAGSVVFTFLEISPVSIGFLEKTIASFDLSAWVRAVVLADATTYQVDPAMPVHILVGEMMQAGLREEPQVAAMYNLAPQLAAGAFLLPQSITVQAGLLHPGRNQDRMMGLDSAAGEVYQLLGSAFELSQPAIAANPAAIFPELEVVLPADRATGFSQLALFTRLQVFEQDVLDIWESGLTQPLLLMTLPEDCGGQKIGLRYQLGKRPGFQCRVIT